MCEDADIEGFQFFCSMTSPALFKANKLLPQFFTMNFYQINCKMEIYPGR